jgi:arsenate reductase-like glutaredoxin family protein
MLISALFMNTSFIIADMKKVYYLSTCDTCKRIMSSLDLTEFVLQDIKTEPISVAQLEEMHALSGSYLALFSKVARKYRGLGLHEKTLTEEEMKNYILDEYTFLKRPVFLIDDQIFIGNSKKNIAAVTAQLA